MPSPREVLQRLKWTSGLDGVEVAYVHRGAPGDERVVRASGIRELGDGFFEVEARPGASGSIPYHRVLRITRGADIIWARRGPR